MLLGELSLEWITPRLKSEFKFHQLIFLTLSYNYLLIETIIYSYNN